MFGDYQPTRLDFVDWLKEIEVRPGAPDVKKSQLEACRIKGKPRPRKGATNPADARTPTEVSNSIWAHTTN